MKEHDKTIGAINDDADDSFLSRWSRRKQAATSHPSTTIDNTDVEVAEKSSPSPSLSDADMPPVESLQADSNINSFLSTGVSDELQRKAFRKIFLSARFNHRDGLDDYDDDFTSFETLGETITAEYRRWMERREKLKQRLEETQAAPLTEDSATVEPPSDECEETTTMADTTKNDA